MDLLSYLFEFGGDLERGLVELIQLETNHIPDRVLRKIKEQYEVQSFKVLMFCLNNFILTLAINSRFSRSLTKRFVLGLLRVASYKISNRRSQPISDD